jgi:Homeodomain-like domain-containing protein
MPGPTPTFCPVFPEDFLRQAQSAGRRKTPSHQAVQRYQLALLLHQEPPLPPEEIGHRVGFSGSQVRRWRKRWTAGDCSVADTSGRGRQPTFSPAGPRIDPGGRL